MYSLLPEMLTSAAHVTFASIALFLLHSGGGREYQAIENQDKDDPQGVMIEKISDDGSDEEEEEGDCS
jgi:hypothetical protein